MEENNKNNNLGSYVYGVITKHRYFLLLVWGTWGVYFTRLFWKMIEMRPDGLYVGHQNVWSDWALHISMANTFAFKSIGDWFAYHPLYAGGKMTYPFLINFISGMFMRMGFSLPMSFILPSIFLSLVMLTGMYFLFYILLRSRWQAFIAISIFMLSAGMGFINFFQDFYDNPNINLFSNPPDQYSRVQGQGWYAGNVIVGLLAPQRSFLIGMAMGVWVLVGLLASLTKNNWDVRRKKMVLVISGIIAGIMPIAHAHGFMVIVLISGIICFTSFRQWRLILYYIISAGFISSALYLKFIWGGIENDEFSKWLVGWVAKGGFLGWILMWLRHWGATIPTAIVGFFMIRKRISSQALAFFAACFGIFVLGNLYLFQPIHWDNTKLFWWAYLGFSGLSAFVIARLWKGTVPERFLSIVLAFVLMFTGVLELTLLQRIEKHSFQITSNVDISLGLEVRKMTDPRAVFLTAPQHNHFIMVWGLRPILIGYTAWAWNYGFNYREREADMKLMYLGESNVLQLLNKYHISYVVIGPTEIRDLNANENFFSSNFNLAFKNQNYRIYDTRNVLRP